MREKAGVEVWPVGRHADLGVIEIRPGQWIESKGTPERDEDRGKHGDLHAQGRKREQEQERVAHADLRQRIFERPVRLLTLEGAKEDAEEDQRDAAPECVTEQALKALTACASIRQRERHRGADKEREGGLDQIVERASLPRHV